MNVLILQPPVMQLNTAYPSGAYLASFFRSLKNADGAPVCKSVRWRDLNIELFYEIFSRSGLERLFSLSCDAALARAEKAERAGDEETAFNLRRYVSERALWINWIDVITALLRGEERESAHRFVFGAHVPRGSRMERYLADLQHDVTTDDARALASFALADLADYITASFDGHFALVRYAESLTVSEASFEQIARGADSPVMRHFYQPVLERVLQEERALFGTQSGGAACAGSGGTCADADTGTHVACIGAAAGDECRESCGAEPTLVCVSVPFAGTFAAALATGRFFKQQFGERVFVSMGGGFINTELRDCTRENTPLLANYLDALSFDRGYAGYRDLLAAFTGGENALPADGSFYKLRLFTKTATTLTAPTITLPASTVVSALRQSSVTEISTDAEPVEASCVAEQRDYERAAREYEREITSTLIPDFSDIDFSRYPRLVDDTNPMHRLWSDGAWIKVYMAHGCYWHQCAFCDVTLDYVCGYCPTNVHALYESLLAQCQKKGVYGIHFVDEAMPPALMVAFARENLAHGSPLSWWGNIRFEKFFTRDVADFLAAGGLVGVSGGLEIALGSGLQEIHKGTDLPSIVAACCAFKEAGILVHAYMIYGYWKETPQDLINSMETLRQFYANGLLDSSFWHKFVLTRHSRIYKEWKEGKVPDLEPIEPGEDLTGTDSCGAAHEKTSQGAKKHATANDSEAARTGARKTPLFAKNGLHFAGEEKSEKYGSALNYSLERWMHGEDLHRQVQKWFDFSVPRPTIPQDFIEKHIASYESARDKAFSAPLPKKVDGCIDSSRVFWLGGEKITSGKRGTGAPGERSARGKKSASQQNPASPRATVRWTYMGEMHELPADSPENAFRGRGLCVLP